MNTTSFEIIKQFLNNKYFNMGTLEIIQSSFSYSEGHIASVPQTPYTIRTQKVLVPLKTKDLIEQGFGEYAANTVFTLFVPKQFRFPNGILAQNGDTIVYDSENYKIISALNFKTHGFYSYTLAKQNTSSLS
jgi:hypothetical protein